MAFFPSLLTPLQRRILAAVGGRLPGVFLTGGTALGAFHLGHRRSADLDFFTRERESYDARVKQFLVLMADAGLRVEAGSAGPGFRRFIVSDVAESLPVDLAVDTAPALAPPIAAEGGLQVDSLDDIAANKLGAVLGRAEVRDYVDLYWLARTGVDLVALLAAAARKDAGLDAPTLAFVLSQAKVARAPEGLEQPLAAEDLQSFIDELRERLIRRAFPVP